jgi:hypothetical protein
VIKLACLQINTSGKLIGIFVYTSHGGFLLLLAIYEMCASLCTSWSQIFVRCGVQLVWGNPWLFFLHHGDVGICDPQYTA